MICYAELCVENPGENEDSSSLVSDKSLEKNGQKEGANLTRSNSRGKRASKNSTALSSSSSSSFSTTTTTRSNTTTAAFSTNPSSESTVAPTAPRPVVYRSDKVVDGINVSVAHLLTKLEGRSKGVYFVWPDLMIRAEGQFRFRYVLIDLKQQLRYAFFWSFLFSFFPF